MALALLVIAGRRVFSYLSFQTFFCVSSFCNFAVFHMTSFFMYVSPGRRVKRVAVLPNLRQLGKCFSAGNPDQKGKYATGHG
jgi:hypothetical protein